MFPNPIFVFKILYKLYFILKGLYYHRHILVWTPVSSGLFNADISHSSFATPWSSVSCSSYSSLFQGLQLLCPVLVLIYVSSLILKITGTVSLKWRKK